MFSAKIGVADVTEPVRRQICLVDVHREDLAPGVDLQQLGMIVDASNLYFHSEGPHVLAGYSIPDEAPGFDFDYDGKDYFEEFIWPRLAHRSSSFERCRLARETGRARRVRKGAAPGLREDAALPAARAGASRRAL